MTLAEELKEKLALEEKYRNKKIQALKNLDTKGLIKMLPELELALEQALRNEVNFRNLNIGYCSSSTSDCAEVKRISAELAIKGMLREDLKKPTVEETKNWLILQRTENDELSRALTRQNDVTFELENNRISIEMAKKRLENIHKVLALRTAQIAFLTSS